MASYGAGDAALSMSLPPGPRFHRLDMSAKPFLLHGRPALRRELPGFSVLLLPAEPYQAGYVPQRHVIGFTLASQQGIHAFGGDARRPFRAEPWRLAFTPEGCDVYSASDRGGEYLLLTVEHAKLAAISERTAPVRLAQFTNVPDPAFTQLALALRRALFAGANTEDLAIEELGMASIALAAAHLGSVSRRVNDRLGAHRLGRIMSYLDANLAGEVRLADLARELCLSEAYLARAFKASTGMTLHAALMDRRIARARSLIGGHTGRSRSLAHIAAESGFASHAHMVTAFRRVLGIAPSHWRSMAGEAVGVRIVPSSRGSGK
jgi:AraC family transcriptional regulator